jgi:hypothetical protein
VCCALANGTERLLIYGDMEVRRFVPVERSYGVTGYVPERRRGLGEGRDEEDE